MPNTLSTGRGGTYIQVDPLNPFEFLTDIGVETVVIPRRAQTTQYLQDRDTGEFAPDDFVGGEIGEAIANFNRPLFNVYNYLLELDCRFNLRVNLQCSGERAVQQNYLTALVLIQSIFESSQIERVIDVTSDNERVNTTAQSKSLTWALLRRLRASRQNITQTQAVNATAFLAAQCYSKCSLYRGAGQIGYAALDTDYLGVYGDTILKTVNFGGDWNPTTTAPFATLGRNALDIMTIPLDGYNHRVLAFGGAMPATYPEISYSDGTRNTAGDVWNNVNPAASAGHGGIGCNRAARDSLGNIWVAADNGRIYLSRASNLGSIWEVSENGQETSEDVNDIAFWKTQGYAVCDNNVVLRKLEDSDTWSALTGPVAGVDLISVETNYLGYVLVGTAGGQVWRSYDEGETWERIATHIPAGRITKISADPRAKYTIWLTHDDAAPDGTVYRSTDGGVNFNAQAMSALANNGLNHIRAIDHNMAVVGGELVGGTGLIGKFESR